MPSETSQIRARKVLEASERLRERTRILETFVASLECVTIRRVVIETEKTSPQAVVIELEDGRVVRIESSEWLSVIETSDIHSDAPLERSVL